MALKQGGDWSRGLGVVHLKSRCEGISKGISLRPRLVVSFHGGKNAWNVEDEGIVFTGEVDLIREEYDLGRRGWGGGRREAKVIEMSRVNM